MNSGSALSTYSDIRLRLAGVLQNLLRFSQERKDDVRSRFIQDLLSDLAEDNFRLAVFGKYNRGKSTLMNALLGMERLPTGVLPLTSVVTTVRYDSHEHVQILREGWGLPQNIALGQLPQYVTEEGNPGNEKKVTLAQIFLPADVLRYGFFLIDTPGVGSSITANTRAAEAFIPRADAAIVVMSVESPLDETELELLQQVYEQVGKVFVVLNKADLVSVEERQRIADIFTKRVTSLIQGGAPVFVLSARNSLTLLKEGRENEDEDLLRLKEALLTFISQEKTGHFLKRMAERIEGLLHDEASINYLAQRSSSDKQQLIKELDEAAGRSRKSGEPLLNALKQSVDQDSTKALEPHLNDWETATEASLAHGEAIIDAIAYLNDREVLVPLQLLPRYGPTVEQLQQLLQQLQEKVVPGVSSRPNELQLGSSVGNAKLSGLPPFAWTAKQRVWLRLRVNKVSVLELKLLSPAIHGYRLFLASSIARNLEQRIDLVREEYERLINQLLERGRAAINGPTTRSDRSAACEQLSRELAEAIRLITAADGISQPTVNGSNRRARSYSACALCEHLVNIQFHFIRQYQHELSVDPEKRDSNASRGGLCAFHTWLYESISSPQGVCSGYSQVPFYWAEMIDQLQAQYATSQLTEITENLLRSAGNCLACEVLRSAESDKLNEVTDNTEHLGSTSLCLPHLCKALSKESARPAASVLLSEMAVTLRRLGEDMQQFALKQSGLRYGWTSTGERSAHLNALRAMVGARPLSYIKTIVEI